jgi:hypothetical protein
LTQAKQTVALWRLERFVGDWTIKATFSGEVVAPEPEATSAAWRSRRRRRRPSWARVLDWVSGALSLDGASCDTGVICLVLCTVQNKARALAELARVATDAVWAEEEEGCR